FLKFPLSLPLLMLKPYTSHHMPLAIRVGSTPANRSLLLLKAWRQQTRWNRSSHDLARRAFFSTLTNSKPTVSCSAIVSSKPCLDDCLTVIAVPFRDGPLIPGFYMPLCVKDPKVLAALQESKSGETPYAGAFLLKDDKDPSTGSSVIHQVGTLAQILSIQGEQVIVIGRERLQITEMVGKDPLTVKTHHLKDKPYDKDDEVIRSTYFEDNIGNSNYRKLAEFLLQKRRRKLTDSGAGIFEAVDFNYQKLADFGAGISDAKKHKIQEVLEELDVHKRLNLTLELVKKQVEMNKIQLFHASLFPESTAEADEDEKVFSSSRFFLIEPIKEKIPKHVLKVIEEQFAKIDRIIRNYGFYTTLSLFAVMIILMSYGQKRFLTRITTDYIICLSGPPGVGKTSIARSVARALDRKFFRLAVGGLSDSSHIKGDRGVYIGAMPGKMVQCLKEVGTENPLVLLDEIDKLGKKRSRDPEGALLELLDPQQNSHFLDYFLDVTIDLSKVLFVCTANVTDMIPGPLLDRMEVITLAGYTTDEKMHIARDYLVKIVSGKCGIKPEQVDVSDTALLSLIENYCREAGVRNLQKQIEKIFRKEEYGSAEYVKQNRLSDTFRKRIEPIKEKIPKHVLEVIEEELANLDRKEYGFGSTDSIYSYLDWLTALPWGNCSDENFDVLRAEKILDEDHYGLHVVKERILEFIAVANLTGNPEGRKIICLSGPPGVGKTSVARSVARALGRKFFRLAVGGLSDSSEIKGDRRVYIGATPGKMVQCLKEVGTENPLVLLDEIDKLGNSCRDPEGALLELLDPEQNAHFLDYFLDVPIDLSKIALKLVRQQASAKAAMVDLESSETAAEGSIELTNEYLRLADVLKVFEHAVGGGSTREESREVVALPLLRKPLIPGFYMPLYVKDPKVLAALQESKSGRAPYAGAFLLKDDKYASTASSSSSFETVNILDSLKGKESLNKIHQVGTLAQILSIQGEQVILIGRKRLQITEMLSEDPLTVKTHHIKDKPYDKDDEVIIKATYFEVISMLRDVLETTSLWRDQVKTYTQDIGGSNYRKLAETILQKRRRKFTGFGAGIFEAIDVFYQKLTGFGAGVFDANDLNYKKLADFGAGISGANKHKIQEVLEELDVHKRLVLVKKQVEVDKIQVFHASIFPESTAKTVEDKQEESGSANYVEKTQPSDKFRERVYSKLILEEIPKHVVKVMEEKFEKLDRGEKDSRSTESIYNYLDWLTALPWGECSDDSFDVLRAEKILDEDHYGLRDVKERILEFIAVGTLTSNPQGRIICLSGPPGVGKTSIARSVARALNRKFFRIAVGGLSDSAEIKGERGIYIGAAPGKMVQCLKEVGTENPLVLLDEIDKLGKSSRDDPEGALLELLDPQQNTHFLDYFLDVTIDLSKVLFVCTANDTDKISGPLLDRMEVIELAGYTTDEKMHIARDYLLKNVKRKCGLKPEQVDVSDTALLSLIENYCREAGVRNIQKHIEKIFRKIALKLVRQQASALAAMTDLKSSETAAKGSIELTNEYLRLADVLKVFEYAVGGGPTREKSKEIALKLGRQQASTKAAKTDLKSYNEYLRLMELEYALAGGPMSDKSRAVPEFTIDASNLADYVGKPVFRGEKIYEQTPVGVVMGLAWTSMGGSTLYIETTFVEEGEGKGGLHITGHLGKVMKESAEIAHTVARRIMFDKDPGNLFFANSKLHLHVPEGATPKDGPSAGCTMITSLLSLAMKKPVRKDLAMTGEVTLTGRILPIGGLKEKTMAARRSQVKVIIFPEANRRDFEGLEESVKEGLDVHFVDEYEQIFELAFGHDH
ncbi:unnamed protein product, partial [Brassica rapa]